MADLPRTPITRQEEYLSRLAGENTTLPREPITREEMYLEGAIARVEAVEEEVEEIKSNPDVVDIVGTYEDLEDYDTSTLTDKDIIRVLEDSNYNNNSTYYRWDASASEFEFVGEIAGGGDSIYSDKNTYGNGHTGAIYAGGFRSDTGQPILDPSTTDNHLSYVWLLPNVSSGVSPTPDSVAILGRADGNGVAIGPYTVANASGSIALGSSATAYGRAASGVALGKSSLAAEKNSVAAGAYAKTTRIGEFNIGVGTTGEGYDNTNYRILGGVHDGIDLHDAASVAQGNTLATTAPTTSTVGVLGQLYTDTTTMHTYQCTAINGNTYTWTQRW